VGDAVRVQRKNERAIHWQESCFAILPKGYRLCNAR
jgi:hypothetical protein